ncbi:bifunctional phosphopantothenoylcysteine decarboxylase/phosphopantothenate--cysteine ligase CoaBC [Demetria terragena]|uniref:bifunctional phosphopantothenoylcysteine decarboxylase/phosphopantothenate--cysteine ligase CoaBC n=1 Tax=Demetria terragena TaxID=63959 RepID=UPI00036F3D8A|nr:bifunctional phosphopantothenoylcysteine decarboxylase/phosphopantothenate--cysteine ligase CoaBC [Demetria terragena]
MRIVLGVSGGIAAYKACLLLRRLSEQGHEVTVIPTEAALRFVGEPTWAALSGRPVQHDVWTSVHEVPHVRLGQSADLVIVAPATADLIAKAAHGLADDLLTNTLLTTQAPVVIAPAMHTEMWQHAATQANVATLRDRGLHVMDPASGRLTGSDTGPGRLAEPEDIEAFALAAVQESLGAGGASASSALDLAGTRVLVSAGGTREPLDPVRYLGNRSSGKQGHALAEDASRRGAQVTLVTTTDRPAPTGADVVGVETALEMRDAVLSRAADHDIVVMVAAVADFRPKARVDSKIKKTIGQDDAPTIELVRNPDILAELVQQRGEARFPILVGFAAETGDRDGGVLDHARAKLIRKGCDLLVANEVGDGVTFGQDTSTVHLLRLAHPDEVQTIGPADKDVVARAVWDVAVEMHSWS